jgi:hypothetical protein
MAEMEVFERGHNEVPQCDNAIQTLEEPYDK